MTPALSVVMPVHNEAPQLAATIDALVEAVDRGELATELVLVDDGSSDGSGGVATTAARGRIPIRVLRQQNQGRFEARRIGVEAAAGEWVLLLDARVRIHPDALAFVRPRLPANFFARPRRRSFFSTELFLAMSYLSLPFSSG